MNKRLILATSITSLAYATSLHLTLQPNLTEAQQDLLHTSNEIALTGTTAIFELLDKKEKK
jgi:hypothetical protein